MHDSKFEIKFEEETKGLKDLCEKLEKRASVWFDDIAKADTEEAGEVIDMIKDLYEAKEKMAKTCYYKSIVKAMEKAEEDEEKYAEFEKHMMQSGDDGQWGRMGYDRWRWADGRFAPRGRGHRSGYTPYLHMMEDDEYDFPDMINYRMGYSGGRDGGYGMNRGGQNRSSDGDGYDGNDGSRGRNEGSRYGRSYDNYRAAKRHYTESKNPEEQKKMKEHIDEIFDDMGDITADVVKDLTPEERQRYKARLQAMMQKMQ